MVAQTPILIKACERVKRLKVAARISRLSAVPGAPLKPFMIEPAAKPCHRSCSFAKESIDSQGVVEDAFFFLQIAWPDMGGTACKRTPISHSSSLPEPGSLCGISCGAGTEPLGAPGA